MKFNFILGRNSQLIYALVLPGFIGIIPLYIILDLSEKYSTNSDSIIIISVLLYLVSVVFFTLKWVKAVRPGVEIVFENNQLHFSFLKKNILFRKDFIIPISDILNVSEDNDKGYDFIYLETSDSKFPRFYLMSGEDDVQFDRFKENLYRVIGNNNERVDADSAIKFKSVYQKLPMKLFAALLIICCFIFPVVFFYQGFNLLISLKYWLFVAISSTFAIKVWIYNFKK